MLVVHQFIVRKRNLYFLKNSKFSFLSYKVVFLKCHILGKIHVFGSKMGFLSHFRAKKVILGFTHFHFNLKNSNLVQTRTCLLSSISIPTPTENLQKPTFIQRRLSSGKKKKSGLKKQHTTPGNLSELDTNHRIKHNPEEARPDFQLNVSLIDSGLKSASVPSTPCVFGLKKMDELREDEPDARITANNNKNENTDRNENTNENTKQIGNTTNQIKNTCTGQSGNPLQNTQINETITSNISNKSNTVQLRRSESSKKQRLKPNQSGGALSSEASPIYRRGLAARRASACLPAALTLDQISSASATSSTSNFSNSTISNNLTNTTRWFS